VHGVAGVEVRAGNQLGRLVASFRTRQGWSQEELARSGLSVRAISDVERGHVRRPRRASIALHVDALDLTEAERGAVADAVREAYRSAFVDRSGSPCWTRAILAVHPRARARQADGVEDADAGLAPWRVAATLPGAGSAGSGPQLYPARALLGVPMSGAGPCPRSCPRL